jgi:hypothetical protein
MLASRVNNPAIDNTHFGTKTSLAHNTARAIANGPSDVKIERGLLKGDLLEIRLILTAVGGAGINKPM